MVIVGFCFFGGVAVATQRKVGREIFQSNTGQSRVLFSSVLQVFYSVFHSSVHR